ncbi:MAG: 30S ribosomal protein S17 [Candidatus Liptonbacteria bacterium CG11_big_fil_rev_8_21_14_0_20_35_14]|uniref:Small ribosomal subunit protein uS17 n=1 Tax=Candidatus Liptonbacteria bacterium CG11_big_fil_rev_8_21_14_0_20_35_14 TaxID=1974634 RepID=A0A2H0N853_9BACT|nr:MAG: 30S ribosomal protein S17 [Candidatus Liptonbacteria bacterium CG11_big_fil_rev_8_21_14_0_20_35_14]
MDKRKLQGKIVSDKMDKTRVVSISRLKKDSKYEKFITVTKKFKAHDEKNKYHTGDEVIMEESKSYSKDKRWRIIKLVKKSESKVEPIEDIKAEENNEAVIN